MPRHLFAVCVSILLASTSTVAQTHPYDDLVLFRSKEHNFRIKFPKDWAIRDGDGPNVVKKAVDGKGSIISVVVMPPSGKHAKNVKDREMSQTEVDYFLNEMIGGLKKVFPDTVVLDKGVRYVSNWKTAYVKARGTAKSLDKETPYIIIQYSTVRFGKLYTVNVSSPAVEFDELKPIFDACLANFVFEKI